ncbi:MAG: serine hydrolase [Chitinophagales bacterium]|nr:serine hydrolase [Chitinophagales bacterium]MDW8418565.1 glycoside hydrolase family 3 N-terminal domain-containing protein [Chitinophagales bacterium]
MALRRMVKRIWSAVFIWPVMYSTAQSPDFLNWKSNAACVRWVDSVYEQLSWIQRVGQCFMLPAYTQGNEFNMHAVLEQVREGRAGGVLFFKGTPEAQAEWTNAIQAAAKIPCLIAIDGEWGVAMRLDSVPAFPRQMTLGAIHDNTLIYEMGRAVGRQCKRLGVHVNFAPAIDLNNNPQNPVINERSFGEDKHRVALKGLEYALGMQDEGILACAKHFPGHGDVTVDSHHDLPVINKNKSELYDYELYPFRILLNNGVGSVMVAHLHIPAYDATPQISASLSRTITTDVLKNQLHYEGLIFSDALNMKGVSKFFKPGVVDSLAFVAGCDILVYTENATAGIEKILSAIRRGTLPEQEAEARIKKILAYKYLLGLHTTPSVSLSSLREDLQHASYQTLRYRLYEAAITIAANRDSMLPLRNLRGMRLATVTVNQKVPTEFQKIFQLYTEGDLFYLPAEPGNAISKKLIDSLADYDVVIVNLHGMVRSAGKRYNVTHETVQWLRELHERTKVVLVVYGNPYSLKYVDFIPWMICAYEDNDATQTAAANAIFGAIPVKGKLPVTVSEKLKAGSGFYSTEILRLKISPADDAVLFTDKLREADSLIARAIDLRAFPGCQVLLAVDGRVVYHRSAGHHTYDKLTPVRHTDLYDLASITKVAATTLAVMKLYEQGKIDLDKTVAHYIPLPRGATIGHLKVRDLLLHQAGLKPFLWFWKETVGVNRTRYYRRAPESEYRVPVAESLFMRNDYPDTMWYLMATSAVDARPGYVYSDIDFYILQKIAEHVSGERLDSFVYRHFYEPMGLRLLTFCPTNRFKKDRLVPTENDTAFRKQIVHGYVHDPGAAMYGGVAGHAGLFGNAFDVAALFQMLVNNGVYGGQRYFDTATVRLFTSRQSKISRRGLGFDKPEPDVSKPSPCFDGAPLTIFGHTGFTGTCVWADPDYRVVFVFLSNRVHPSADNNLLIKLNIRTKLQEILYKALGY